MERMFLIDRRPLRDYLLSHFVRIDYSDLKWCDLTSDLIRQNGIPGSSLLHDADHYDIIFGRFRC
jgi:hypothetical protein